MAIRLGSQISALSLTRRLNEHTAKLSNIFEGLSSGMRINSAGDDAAGLALRDALRSDRVVFKQAIRNVNDGISAASIVESALGELRNITQRQLELAQQAANGTYTLAQRQAMHAEANALVSEFNRIVASTQFNGINLLDGSRGELSIQVGKGANSTISLNLDDIFSRDIGTGSFSAGTTLTTFVTGYDIEVYDFNGDGKLDIAVGDRGGSAALDGVQIMLGNGDGTFSASATYGGSVETFDIEYGDVNGDGIIDIVTSNKYANSISVLLGNGDGSFKAKIDSATPYTSPVDLSLGDINGDGKLDLVAGRTGDDVILMFGTGTGTFTGTTSIITDTNNFTSLYDINGDGKADLISATSGSDEVYVRLSNGDGTFRALQSPLAAGDAPVDIKIEDFNGDGYLDIVTANFQTSDNVSVFLGNSNGTFQAGIQYDVGQSARHVEVGDINGDGYNDLVVGNEEETISVLFGNGDGSFKAKIQNSTIFSGTNFIVPKLGDFNGDGVTDIAVTSEIGTPTVAVLISATDQTSTEQFLYLLNQTGAHEAITTLQATLARISKAQSSVGAFESRLSHTYNYLTVMTENLAAAESRISDIDVASQVAEMVRLQILQQTTTALLAQSNLNADIVLKLLGGK